MTKTTSTNTDSPFQVLGIGLVVEGLGKGARLVFRYPTKSTHEEVEQDLFFTLPPRVLSKLFRPKKPLCGQPMTVSVGGIIFCCRAVLLDDYSDEDGNESQLVLFSVIVAVAPSLQASGISGWFEANVTPEMISATSDKTVDSTKKEKNHSTSTSFRSLRQIHLSLARLCRVLEREEVRCQYVSSQSLFFLSLRNDFGLSDDGIVTTQSPSSNSAQHGQTTANSSVVSGGQASDGTGKLRHRRIESGSLAGIPNRDADFDAAVKDNVSSYQEREQEALGAMLSSDAKDEQLHGNLARELVQVYHLLSRDDHSFMPSTMGSLSGQDGIIYINGHVAVPIEPIAEDNVSTPRMSTPLVFESFAAGRPTIIRPYHTLLFPNASPAEVLDTLTLSTSTVTDSAPRRLEQLVLMANPRKTMAEIAADAALPLNVALEVASYLLSHGTCIVSPALNRSSKFAPKSIELIKETSLEFSQNYGPNLNILLVTSVLTTAARTLGEIMSRISSSTFNEGEDATVSLLGDKIAESLSQPIKPSGLFSERVRELPISPGAPIDIVRIQDVEDVVYNMAVWLRSRQVIVELKDFLVAIGNVNPTPVLVKSNSDNADEKRVLSESVQSSNSQLEQRRTSSSGNISDQALFDQMRSANCLNGKISTVALAWKFGLDSRRLHRFRTWGLRHHRIRVVTRVANSEDDWSAA